MISQYFNLFVFELYLVNSNSFNTFCSGISKSRSSLTYNLFSFKQVIIDDLYHLRGVAVNLPLGVQEVTGLIPGNVIPKMIKRVVSASLLGTQHERDRERTGWLGVGIMVQMRYTCIPVALCLSELAV